jgi:uncharacterized membrane protein
MTRKYDVAAIVLLLAAVAVTVAVYPNLPDRVPTHWDVHNRVNGYSPRWALFLTGPGMMAIIMLVFSGLPWLSPKQFEVESFRDTAAFIMLAVVSLLAYIHGIILWAGLGHSVNVGRAIVGGVCLLFALMGNVMGKVRRNFYIGVRTPWALANDRVWNATHRFAAKTMVASGVIGFLLTVLGSFEWLAFSLAMAGVIIPVFYSLIYYKQLERRGEL